MEFSVILGPIAQAPLVVVFFADYQWWFDYYRNSNVNAYCLERGLEFRGPDEAVEWAESRYKQSIERVVLAVIPDVRGITFVLKKNQGKKLGRIDGFDSET